MTVPSKGFFQRWKFRQLDEDDIPGFHESLPPKTAINGPRSGSPDAHLDKQPTAPLAAVVVDSASPVESASIWQASLGIGGITCAACVNIITEELEKKYWIKNVSLNLIAHGATIDFIGEAHKDDIVEAIEDLGYDAALDIVVDLNELKPARESTGTKRTVDVLVKGMFCEEYPARVLAALAECFADRVCVDKPLTTQEPILRLSYILEVPSFTIRHIIAAMSAANGALELPIYRPQSLEDRSRQMHAQEQRRLILRVLVTSVIAIPTLIIGITYMSLIPSNGPGHQFLDQPLFDRVGDGINDSPALTTAEVGIAIGSGSDIAISSAEFVLITSNLNSLITLLDLSRTVFRRIKFNFVWAFVYNTIALPVAAGVLYPILASNGKHVRLDPVWASLAMALSSISVVCSSLA